MAVILKYVQLDLCVILLWVLLLTGQECSSQSACSGVVTWSSYPQKTVSGGGATIPEAKTYQTCLQTCLDNPSCQGGATFDFTPGVPECLIHMNAVQNSDLVDAGTNINFAKLVTRCTDHSGVDDPCPKDHAVLDNNQYRDVDYEPDYDFETLCDHRRIIEGSWFRLSNKDNERMPESCVSEWRCGTWRPIWLNGSHPTDDQIATRTVCLRSGDNCCYWSDTVNIKRCPSGSSYYYIYQLPDPPFCSSGYCLDTYIQDSIPPTSGTPSPTPSPTPTPTVEVTSSTTTTTPGPTCSSPQIADPRDDTKCLDPYPEMSGFPGLEGPYLEDEEVAIYCSIHYTRNDVYNRERFYVRFLFNGVIDSGVPEVKTNKTMLRVRLPQMYLADRIGKMISCNVLSSWDFSTNRRSLIKRSSEDYWTGIQTSNGRTDTVTVDIKAEDDDPAQIQLQSTIPITCPSGTPRCQIDLRLFSQDSDIQYGFACSYYFKRNDWKQNEKLTYGAGSITIKGTRSPVFLGDRTYQLQFETLQFGPGYIWNGYNVAPITISYHDAPYGLCSVQFDSAVTTFDKHSYDVLGKGEFFLLRSSSKRLYEVQIRTGVSDDCPAGRPCVCGVAVRERNTVIALDRCRMIPGQPVRVAIYKYNSQLPPGYSVTRNGPGTQFSVNLPSGAHVIADVKSYGLDVFVYAISEDYKKTSGLCGMYDNNGANDPTPADTDRHKVPKGDSFFDKEPSDVDIDDPVVEYCHCDDPDTDDVICGSDEGNGLTDKASYYGVPGKDSPGSDIPPSIKDPKDKMTDKDYDKADEVIKLGYTFDYGDTYVPPPPPSWPTPKGLIEGAVIQQCQNTIRSTPFFSACQATGIDEADAVDKCVKSVQKADDLDIATEIISGYEQQCVFDASTQVGQDDKVLDKMCPGGCSTKGQCQNQICTCDTGFIGADCSLPSSQAPELYNLLSDAKCDIRQKPCQSVNILASGITDEGDLTCRITFVNDIGEEGSQYETKATLRTSTEVICELPPSPLIAPHDIDINYPRHSWKVEVSNDGLNYQGSLQLELWDSKCLDCGDSCSQKPNTCLIDGRCYAARDESPDVGCMWCDPSQSSDGFSPVPENRAPTLEPPYSFTKLSGEQVTGQLTANDPDGQTSFVFTLYQPPSVPGVSLTTEGRITITDEADNATINIKASDSCGSSDIETFRIYSVDCPCTNNHQCDQSVAVPSAPSYFCQCLNDDCAISIPRCLSLVCSSVNCVDNSNTGGYDCFCSSDDDGPDRCSYAGSGEWGDCGSWGECSKQCDYGIRQCRRECIRGDCQGSNLNTELCAKESCPENEAEKYEGVIVVTSVNEENTIDEILKDISSFLEIIRKNVNQACKDKVKPCCNKDIWLNPGKSYEFVPTSHIFLAASYPQVNKDDLEISFKILARIPSESLEENCGVNRRKRAAPDSDLSEGGRIVPKEVIEDAVDRSVSELEEKYGFEIKSVQQEDGKPEESYMLYIYIGAGVVGLVVIVVVIVLLIKQYQRKQEEKAMKQQKRKGSSVMPHPNSNSYARHTAKGRQPDLIPSQKASRETVTSFSSIQTVYDELDDDYLDAKRESGVYYNIHVPDKDAYDSIPVDEGQHTNPDYDDIFNTNYQHLERNGHDQPNPYAMPDNMPRISGNY